MFESRPLTSGVDRNIRPQFTHCSSRNNSVTLKLLLIHHVGAAIFQGHPRLCEGQWQNYVTSRGQELRGQRDLEKLTLGVSTRPRTNSCWAPCSVLCLLNEQSCFLSTHKPHCLSNCCHLLRVQICTAWHELGCKLCRKQLSHPSVMSESSSTMWPGGIWERTSIWGLIPSLCSMTNILPAAFGSVKRLNMIEVTLRLWCAQEQIWFPRVQTISFFF